LYWEKGKRNYVLREYLKKYTTLKFYLPAQKNTGNNSGILVSYYLEDSNIIIYNMFSSIVNDE
jgi:hypothetical protein